MSLEAEAAALEEEGPVGREELEVEGLIDLLLVEVALLRLDLLTTPA